MPGTPDDTLKPSKKPLSELVEIDDAKWLVAHDELDPHLKRVYSTQGRVGKIAGLQYDLASVRWAGETKLRDLPKWLTVAYEQIQDRAKRERKHAVLMLHIKGTRQDEHTLHVISRQEHEELMVALKELEQAQARIEELEGQVREQVVIQPNTGLMRDLREYQSGLDSISRRLRDTIREEERN